MRMSRESREGGRAKEEGGRSGWATEPLQWNFKRRVQTGGYQHVYVRVEEVEKTCASV